MLTANYLYTELWSWGVYGVETHVSNIYRKKNMTRNNNITPLFIARRADNQGASPKIPTQVAINISDT